MTTMMTLMLQEALGAANRVLDQRGGDRRSEVTPKVRVCLKEFARHLPHLPHHSNSKVCVFTSISMATVIGPTPPGTGVMKPAL